MGSRPESDRWAAAKALVIMSVAWGLHAVADLASLAPRQNELVVIAAGVGFGIVSLAAVVQLVRALPPSGARAALLVVAFGSVVQALLFFFFYRPGTSRLFGALAGGLLVAALASVYAKRRYRAPLGAICLAAAMSVTVSVFDAAARAASGSWVVDRDVLSDVPVVAPVGTLLLAGALVAIFADLRRQLRAGASPVKRPPKTAAAPWRDARRFLLLYYQAFIAKFALAVLLVIAVAAAPAALPVLAGLADLVVSSAGALALARFGSRAHRPRVRALALASALCHLIAVVLGIVVLTTPARTSVLLGIGAVATIALVFLCAALAAVGKDIDDVVLPGYAKETALLVVIGTPVTYVFAPLLASTDLTVTMRGVLAGLVPVLLALPLAGSLSTFVMLRRATWVIRARAA